jgi:hypothetical protein
MRSRGILDQAHVGLFRLVQPPGRNADGRAGHRRVDDSGGGHSRMILSFGFRVKLLGLARRHRGTHQFRLPAFPNNRFPFSPRSSLRSSVSVLASAPTEVGAALNLVEMKNPGSSPRRNGASAKNGREPYQRVARMVAKAGEPH